MKLSIDLTPAQAERLRLEAGRLGLTPEELARAAIADLLASPGADFDAAAERVLKKSMPLLMIRNASFWISLPAAAAGANSPTGCISTSDHWRDLCPSNGQAERPASSRSAQACC